MSPRGAPRVLVIACLLFADVFDALAAGNETLEFFNDELEVMTASRRKETAHESPVSVEVITAEDIRASGAVNIWDLLRFRAGLDVEDASGKDGLVVVSIRGFARSTLRQLQVLIDGRSVYSPSRAAVNWEQLPVQLQDIERIEVVRGPNAVLYGSNTGVGAVNIITKKPTDQKTASAGVLAGNENLRRSEAAAQESIGRFHFRLSQTHMSRDGTSLPGGGAAGDFLFSNKQNFRGRWDLGPGSTLDLFAGGSWDTLGADTTPPAGARQNRYRQHFEMARWTQTLAAGELELSGARNEATTNQEKTVGLASLREFQYDGEAVYRLGWLDGRMQTVGGAGYRLAVAESDQLFAGDPKQQNRISRAFVNQSAKLFESVTLTGGVSMEHSDTSGYEPAYQFAGVFAPSKEHAFRLSFSCAPTLPSLYDEHANSLNSASSRRVGNPNLDSDHLRSYEAGYEGIFWGRLSSGVNLFYLDHRDLNETVVVSKVGPLTTTSADNNNAALARGAELTLKFKFDPRREVYANYTYEHVTDRTGHLDVTHGAPAHKFNAGGRAALPGGFSISANLGYKDAYASGGTSGFIDIPAYWRLDGRLSWDPTPRLELFIAGQNLSQPFHGPEFKGSEAAPRTYYGGVSVNF